VSERADDEDEKTRIRASSKLTFFFPRRSKEILSLVPLPTHPFLALIEEQKLEMLRSKGSGAAGAVQDVIARGEFLKAMANFRTKETIFEVSERSERALMKTRNIYEPQLN